MFQRGEFSLKYREKKSLLLTIFLRLEQYSANFNLLSIVTLKILKPFTTLTLMSSFLSLTNLETTVIK